MTTPVHADPRRTSVASSYGFHSGAQSEGTTLELPVLFQLADLSQFQVLAPPPKPKPERTLSSNPVSTVESVSASSHAAADGIKLAAAPAAESPAAPATTGTGSDAAVRSSLDAAEPAGGQPLPGSADNAGGLSPPPADAPTVRERTQLRERRRQAVVKGDWFSTQGKYIVIVFLIALAGTVIFARRGDDSPPSPAQEAGVSEVAGDDSADANVSGEQLVPTEQPPVLAAETSADPGAIETPAVTTTPAAADLMAETSPAEQAHTSDEPAADFPGPSASDASPQISLQAPIESGPASTTDDDKNLFPWNQPEAERVATRPAAPAGHSSVPMPQRNPHFQARPPTPGAAATAPPNPQQLQPGDGAAPAVYPITDPENYRTLPPQPRSPGAGDAAPASHESRVPPAPRTTGPRYERTGSGVY